MGDLAWAFFQQCRALGIFFLRMCVCMRFFSSVTCFFCSVTICENFGSDHLHDHELVFGTSILTGDSFSKSPTLLSPPPSFNSQMVYSLMLMFKKNKCGCTVIFLSCGWDEYKIVSELAHSSLICSTKHGHCCFPP